MSKTGKAPGCINSVDKESNQAVVWGKKASNKTNSSMRNPLLTVPTPTSYSSRRIVRFSSIFRYAPILINLARESSKVEKRPSTMHLITIKNMYVLITPLGIGIDVMSFKIKPHFFRHVLEKFRGQDGESFSKVELPLLETYSSDLADHPSNVLTNENFQSTIGHSGAWLVQVYSSGSKRSAQFSNSWKRIVNLLDGVGRTGMVELGEVQLAAYLAERKPTGQPFFRQGLPSLAAFPPACRNADCLVRYYGDLSVDAVTDWFSTDVLGLPRILYYSKEILGQKFIASSGHHKVKVICFSRTGERAPPFLRQAAKDYWAYASFAFVLWKEEESSFWWDTFEIESAPAIVLMKDPGVKPVVLHGAFNSSSFSDIMERNKQQDLPQLRSLTSLELGCDARGYSRAGNETTTWYCVILAGRHSPELGKMRETIRRIQDVLSNEAGSTAKPAAVALKEKRLTFTWLDGEAQKKYCFFYINSESSYETCGPRRDLSDVPELIIVRYKRNFTQEEKVERKPKSIWETFEGDNEDLASQLVAKYNGSGDIPQIINWVSQIIEDGDSRDLPFFRTKTPELIPEDADPIWSRGAQNVVSTSKGMKQRIRNIMTILYDWMGDPRIGPILLLGASLSFGSIWFHRNQSTKASQSSEPSVEEKPRPKRRARTKTTANKDRASSITDNEPNDAYQLLSSVVAS
ncbi:Dnaj heat shock n-terminal domain-containing protein [Thalictrum thalictroides]|uniref:Dnaj heat shock n-terminal domain-containing protein n=1 Tax=Thalictrum thalictroides TaxID=46969 RepID=A0A7J6X769_THATH|nr:Dnaj heat shock n-terminal domain-containing protein [Thalictrum thalictroides]